MKGCVVLIVHGTESGCVETEQVLNHTSGIMMLACHVQGYHAAFVETSYCRRVPFYQQFDGAKPDIIVKCGVEWELSHFIRCRHQTVVSGLVRIDSLATDERLYLMMVTMNIGRNSIVFNCFRVCIINYLDELNTGLNVWIIIIFHTSNMKRRKDRFSRHNPNLKTSVLILPMKTESWIQKSIRLRRRIRFLEGLIE